MVGHFQTAARDNDGDEGFSDRSEVFLPKFFAYGHARVYCLS